MDTDKLRYFVTVAESGSLTKASGILNISHSGLSKAIGALETEIKRQLFRPQGRGLEITPEGKWFYQKAKEILKIAEEVAVRSPVEVQPIRIGLSGVIAMTCAGALANELEGPLLLTEVDVGEVEGKIVAGDLDFGIAFVPSPQPELEYLEIGEVHFASCARADLIAKHDSAKIPYAVPTSEYPSNPLGYRNRDGWPGEIPRTSRYAVGEFSIALDLVRSGHAAVYMPSFVAALENSRSRDAGKIVTVKEYRKTQSTRKLFLVKRQNVEESRAMKKVVKVIKRICCSTKL